MLASTALATLRAEEWSFVARLNRALAAIIPGDAKVEKLAGTGFLEGPVWVRKGSTYSLAISDIPANVIYMWNPTEGKASVYLAYSGFTGSDDSGAGMQLLLALKCSQTTRSPMGFGSRSPARYPACNGK